MGLDALRQGRWRQGGLRGADELVLGRRSTQLPHRRRAGAGAPFWLHMGGGGSGSGYSSFGGGDVEALHDSLPFDVIGDQGGFFHERCGVGTSCQVFGILMRWILCSEEYAPGIGVWRVGLSPRHGLGCLQIS